MFFLPSARMGLEVPLQAYSALKILYVLHRTITETPHGALHTKRPYLSSQICQERARSASRRASWRPRPACLAPAAPYELGTTAQNLSFALYPVYLRGEAYVAAHQGGAAAAEFQKILDHPRRGHKRANRRTGALGPGTGVCHLR